MTVRALYNEIRKRLSSAVEDPVFEALCLVEYVFGMDRSALLLKGDTQAAAQAAEQMRLLADRRINGEPLQYLLGKWPFMNLELFCGEGVLIPREDTSVLVYAAKERLNGKTSVKGVDLCAGTGAVALAMAMETGAKITAVELFDGAFSFLERNLEKYPELSVCAVRGDVLSKACADTFQNNLELIVSNPPYIETEELPTLQKEVQHEPMTALDGGRDGLVFYRAICDIWAEKLCSGGVLAVEIGETQGEVVAELFRAAGLHDIRIHKDLGELDRAVSGIK